MEPLQLNRHFSFLYGLDNQYKFKYIRFLLFSKIFNLTWSRIFRIFMNHFYEAINFNNQRQNNMKIIYLMYANSTIKIHFQFILSVIPPLMYENLFIVTKNLMNLNSFIFPHKVEGLLPWLVLPNCRWISKSAINCNTKWKSSITFFCWLKDRRLILLYTGCSVKDNEVWYLEN